MRHKQGFVARSKARLEMVSSARNTPRKKKHPLAVLGASRAKSRRGKVAVTAVDTQVRGYAKSMQVNPEPPESKRRPLPLFKSARDSQMRTAEIRVINKRLYERLCPEVRQQRKDEARKKMLTANRAKAKDYAQRLRRSTREGQGRSLR